MLSGVSRSKHFPGWGHATFHKASLSFFRSHDVICFPLSLSKYLFPPATKLGQGYVFTGVCDSVHRGDVCLSACWDTHTPWEQTAPPGSRHPPGADTPPRQTPPGADTRPPPQACWAIRSTRGRYASYWNAILFGTTFHNTNKFIFFLSYLIIPTFNR